MSFLLRNLLLAPLLYHATALPSPDFAQGFTASDIITKDVCIIGGGATGTYSAVRLREDMNRSVIVVEQQTRLGGHTETLLLPGSGIPIDYGVLVWQNMDVVKNFFKRFDVPLVNASTSSFQTEYIDLTTGKPVEGYPSADPTAALGAYAAQLQKYPYLVGGYSLPDPVPDDLLLPFGEFVTKYQLEAALPVIYPFANGLGDIIEAPTIYVMQNFGLVQLNDLQTGGFLTTARHDNSEIYDKAQALLGEDVLFGSSVVRTARNVNGKNLVIVQTPYGRKLIKAKKLLITVPPVLDNLRDFDLDNKEKSVFGQLRGSTFYTGILHNTGIPDNVSVSNTDAKAEFRLPENYPFVATIDFTGVPGFHRVYYIDKQSRVSESKAREGITKSILAMNKAGTFDTSTPEFVALKNHAPLQPRVPANSIKNGFYKKMYALQGHRGTFYTGSAWAADYSSLLWQFTEGILPFVSA